MHGQVSRVELTVDVRQLGVAGASELCVTLLLPAASTAPLLLCVPGGGMSGRYFDLDLPGYSFAARMVERGHPVALMDNLGTAYGTIQHSKVSPGQVADAIGIAAEACLGASGVAAPHPCVVAVGHSMGGAGVLWAQQRHASFRALVVLGWTPVGLPELIPHQAQARACTFPAEVGSAARAAALWVQSGHAPEVPNVRAVPPSPEVAAALRGVRAPLLSQVAFASYLPGYSDIACDQIDVPVHVITGDQDIARGADRIHEVFGAAPLTRTVLANCGHDQVVCAERQRLADTVHAWTTELP